MPHRFPFASHNNEESPMQEMGPDDAPTKRLRRSSLLRKPLSLWRRHHPANAFNDEASLPQTAPTEPEHNSDYFTRRSSLPDTVDSADNAAKRVPIPSLPRPQTFRRQQSEKRERLLEVEPTQHEKRAISADRRRGRGLSTSAVDRSLSPADLDALSLSAPNFANSRQLEHYTPTSQLPCGQESARAAIREPPELPPLQIPQSDQGILPLEVEARQHNDVVDETSLREEHDSRWILNLSMHFRDKSNREKFFVTYAERPNQWRRITVSLDYRDAPEDSLEADISTLHYQREKSIRIYEAIRDSLPDIQFYNTVTNLKLETTRDDGQLHVHVREDANEIIDYPVTSLFDHIHCPRFNESQLQFGSHLSGFVYKVCLANRTLIKKEVPGPDTVDEFLYEVNALDSLLDSEHVVQLEGLVTDDRGELVKGLLISYASQGPLVDILYYSRDTPELNWERREKWAKQIVSGLSDIHEAGFVQGDFTLSNIVIDEEDDAKIIDINRRGCPIGWEPPELNRLIDSGQRISMCIGVKTDLFQLGMVLWALAASHDQPERVPRPLPEVIESTPPYFREIIASCLSDRPQERKSAARLLQQFPSCFDKSTWRRMPRELHSPISDCSMSSARRRSAKKYIDPDMAVTIEDVRGSRRPELRSQPFDATAVTYVDPNSTLASEYRLESAGSWVDIRSRTRSRGRSPVSSRRRRSSPYPYGRTESSATSFSQSSHNRRRRSRNEYACSNDDSADRWRFAESCNRQDDAPSSDAHNTLKEHEPVCDRRVDGLRACDAIRVAELTHVDSGFDEMMDALSLEGSQSTAVQPVDRLSTPKRPNDSSHEPATPCSFYTPSASAAPEDAEKKTVASNVSAQGNTT